ncbi:TPA: gp58-like family protein [Enterococcus faecalis]
MLKVSEKFLEKIKSMDRNIVTRITAKNKVYTGNDVNYLKLDYGAMVGESLQLGSTYSNSLEIEFCSVITEFEEMDEIVIELGVVIHDAESDISSVKPAKVGSAKIGSAKLVGYKSTEYEFVNMGTFYITELDPDRNEKKTTIKALDSFVYMEGIYKSELPEMETIRNIAIDIANKAGIKVDLSSFNGLSTARIKTPRNCTYRQAIGMIAQFECGYAHFNRDGLLTIRNLTDPRFKITPSEYFMKGLKKNELMYKLGGISCEVRSDEKGNSETTLLKAGSDKGAQIKISNNSMTQTLLDDMYVKLRNLNFYPYNLSWRGNPALEVGDWITFIDREGNKFKSPNLSYSLEYRGGLKGTSSADTKAISSQTTQFKGPIQQQLDDLYSRVDAAGKNNVYDGITEPKNPKEGDLWFKPNGPDTEIWVYKDGKWVMQTSTALDEDIKEKIENSTPSDEIVKTINLSQEMDGKEWLKITGAKIWLTNQTKIDDAIITHGMIGSVDAGTIKVGTLDAGKIRVVNLDASAISTGTLTAIKITGVAIKSSTIDGGVITNSNRYNKIILRDGTISNYYNNVLRSQINSIEFSLRDSKGYLVMSLQDSGVRLFKRNSRLLLGYLGRGIDSASNKEELSLCAEHGNIVSLNVQKGSGSSYTRFLAVSSNGVHISNITMSGSHVGGSGEIKNARLVNTSVRTKFTVNNNVNLGFYSNLNMHGYSILNQSDIRLKENIDDTKINGIEETKKLNFVEFDRKQNYRTKDKDRQPSSKRELGLIAQYSPFLAVESDFDNYLSIDVNKQIMLNSLTNKQLIELVESQEKRITELEEKMDKENYDVNKRNGNFVRKSN